MHAWSTSILLLLHSTFMLSLVELLLKGEVGVFTLNSHGNYIVDHGKSWKCVFEFLWESCSRDHQQTTSWQRVNKSGSRAEISCALSRVMVSFLFCLSFLGFFLSEKHDKSSRKATGEFLESKLTHYFGLVCCFTSKSLAMVMLGRSDHLTTLFSWASLNKHLTTT